MSDRNAIRMDIEKSIARRATMDPEFREALLKDPKGAVQSLLADEAPGVTLPENLEVKALEEPANAFYVVIPSAPTSLSDADLNAVAGGVSWQAKSEVNVKPS